MRTIMNASGNGASVSDLIKAANQINLQARALSLEIESISSLKLPCILHWNSNHYVVLQKIKNSGLIIHDPANGRRAISFEELDTFFTGIAIEFEPSPKFEKLRETGLTLSSFISGTRGFLAAVSGVAAIAFATELIGLLTPIASQVLFDDVLVGGDFGLLTLVVIGYVTIISFSSLLGFLRTLSIQALYVRLTKYWFGATYCHLTSLPIKWFKKRSSADIVTRFGSIHNIQHIITSTLVSIALDIVMLSLSLIFMLHYSMKLTLIALIAFSLYITIRIIRYSFTREATRKQITFDAQQYSFLLETIEAIVSIRVFNRTNNRNQRYHEIVDQSVNVNNQISIQEAIFSLMHGLIRSAEMGAVVALGANMVRENTLTAGMLIAFFVYKDQFIGRGVQMLDSIFSMKLSKLYTERLSDILLSESEAGVLDGRQMQPTQPSSISLANVSYQHSQTDPILFANISLNVIAGQTVVLVGPSGCGKTTLLSLLMGIVKPTSGEVLFNGQKLSNVALSSIWGHIGVVMQDERLLTGTIAENISFFSESQDLDRVIFAAKVAEISTEIEELPLSYMTLVGDGGAVLSSGQRQRILIARAIYDNPSVLFFDEATNNLDYETESRVMNNICKLQMTKIFVTHRRELGAFANQVIDVATLTSKALP